MTKQNKVDTMNRKITAEKSTGMLSVRIPGTQIPKIFYTTANFDMQYLLDKPHLDAKRIFEDEIRSIKVSALKRIQEYRKRWRIFKFYGCDVGDGFEMDYHMFWATTDDGTIQLLRGDFLAIGMRAINAEMDYFDGKLEEVDGLLKLVKDNKPDPQAGVDNQPIDLERRSL